MNIAKEGPEFVSVAIGTSRSYIKANEDIVRRVVRAYAEGIQMFKNNKAASLRMIERQLKVSDPEIREDAYNQFQDYLEYPPYVSRKGMEAVLAEIADKEPAVRKHETGRYDGYALRRRVGEERPAESNASRTQQTTLLSENTEPCVSSLLARQSASWICETFWRGARNIPTWIPADAACRSARI